MRLFNLYYPAESSECVECVEEYKLCRTHVGNKREDEGIIHLINCVYDYFKQLKEDIYYQEKLKIEAITFLQYVICYQKKNINSWFRYYKTILSMFHELGELRFKESVVIPKNFIKKNDCVVVCFHDTDNTKLHYKAHKELKNDFGRYRADAIIRQKNGKMVDFNLILGLLL